MKWIPEPKPISGGLAAEGFMKLLGRPRLDPLTVLVRETAQNSWDARLSDQTPVDFSIQGWQLEPYEQQALRDDVFVNADEVVGTSLSAFLTLPHLHGLYVTDRNTKGLGGPVRADDVDPTGTYDWVDFVLNVGAANKQKHSGGTYGFGKTISYVVSQARAVVVHSRTKHEGRIETRLLACAIGEKFDRGGKLYTGRHWWADSGLHAPVPATGAKADRLATAIGMPEFEDDDTGTNILIVSPSYGGRTPEQAMRFIAESVTWHLWPKLAHRADRPAPMSISVQWNGEEIPVPRTEDRPPLHGFAQAFEAILDEDSATDIPGLRLDRVRCGRPKAEVGLLATVPLVHRDRASVDDGPVHDDQDETDAPKPAAMILGPSHHVALLRTPELVVEYLEGPPPPEGGTEWAGVFRAHEAQDAHFAAAEPPTHDSWSPELLAKGEGKTIVNVGLREIMKALENRWATRKQAVHIDAASTALVAHELAHLLGSVDGRGRGRRRKDPLPPSKPGPKRPKVDLVFSGPAEVDGELATVAKMLVTPVVGATATRLLVNVSAAVEGKRSKDEVDVDPSLTLVGATVGDNRLDVDGRAQDLLLTDGAPTEVELIVRRGSDTTVLFDVDAESVT